MNPVESWLGEMRDIRCTGAGDPETSYCCPLDRLFNEIGKGLKPKASHVVNLENRGAGKPAKVATARNLWIPAVNNAATWGCWAFIEISDPWDARNALRGMLNQLRQAEGTGASQKGT